jgi:hypothetical protein
MLEKYLEIIVNEFFPERGEEKLRYSVAKKAISDYSKASGNPEETLDLIFTYVENGVKYTKFYGDVNEQFYDSIYGMLSRACDMLWKKQAVTCFGKNKSFIRCSGSGCSRSAKIHAR